MKCFYLIIIPVQSKIQSNQYEEVKHRWLVFIFNIKNAADKSFRLTSFGKGK